MLRGILENHDETPLERLRSVVHAFIQSECEEAQMRGALNDAAPIYRNAPEALEVRAAGRQAFKGFMLELLPEVSVDTRTLASDLILTTLSSVGKEFSNSPRTAEEIAVYAHGMADMFRAYVNALNPT